LINIVFALYLAAFVARYMSDPDVGRRNSKYTKDLRLSIHFSHEHPHISSPSP
jgi:hypothetical protein